MREMTYEECLRTLAHLDEEPLTEEEYFEMILQSRLD